MNRKKPNQSDAPAVLVHVTTVPASLSGFISGQPRFMREQGFAVHVISSGGPLLDRFGQVEGVVTCAVAMTRRITPFRDLAALWQMVGTLRRIKARIVHSHSPKGGLLGMLAAWLARVPVRVYSVRGLPFMTARGFRRAVLIGAERVSCLLAQRVVCVSLSMRRVLLEQRICSAAKAVVIGNGSGNGIDAERYNPQSLTGAGQAVRRRFDIPDDAIVAGFVGRIVKDKGLTEFVAAWLLLKDKQPSLHLLLAGIFEDEDPLPAATIQVLREDSRVHLAGFIYPENLPELYAAMDVFVLPTYREGFPLVVLEASAMQLPIVATAIPGCTDAVVDGITGTLVPVNNDTELASALLRYLTDPLLRAEHGRAGRERVLREYRQESIWQGISQQYRELLDL